MSETVDVLISEAKEVKSGNSGRGPWTLYSVTDGNEERYSHFSASLHSEFKAREGQRARIEYEPSDRGRNALSVTDAPARQQNGGAPSLGTGEYIKGQSAPSDARRMLIRGAQDNGLLAAIEIIKHQTSREITPELFKAAIESFTHFFWEDALRRAGLMEDADIPFMPDYEGK